MDLHIKTAENLQEENAYLREKIAKLRNENGRLEKENERLRRDRAVPPFPDPPLSLNDGFHRIEDGYTSADERIALIQENLAEVLKPEIIEDVVKKQNRPLVIYWGADASQIFPKVS